MSIPMNPRSTVSSAGGYPDCDRQVGTSLDPAGGEAPRRLESPVPSSDTTSAPGAITATQEDPLLADPLATANEKTVPHAVRTMLEFLAPSDRPGSLGRLGPYEILQHIGQGGMGVVFRALDERLSRIVAVKMLAPALAASKPARMRFEREARAAAAVCHENVVTIHAVDEAAGHPYLVMQFVAGQSLQDKIQRKGALELKEILRIGMQVAAGLAAAHEQGLIHRDIKPSNLLLENSVERVKITDFGLARALDDASITDSGVVLGTPHYMSPEQARGEASDHRSDLYSLGSVLFAMCTGQPPFRAESTVAVLRKVSDEPPRSIRELNPEIPEWLAATVARLMAKDPEARFQRASDVAEQLALHLAQLQQPARLVSADPMKAESLKSPRRLFPRARLAIPLIGGLAAILIAAAAWLAYQSFQPARNAKTALALIPLEAEKTAISTVRSPVPPAAVALGAERRSASPAPAFAAVAPEAARKALDLAALGTRAFRLGEISQAIDRYSEAIQLDPTNISARLSRAGVYADQRCWNLPGVIADATEILRLDPKNARAFELRAYVEHCSGDNRRSIADATEALRLDPSCWGAYSHRGSAYNQLGEWKLAIADLNEFLNRYPDSPWPLMTRSMALASLGQDDRALADINRAIELAPGMNRFWFTRAHFFASRRDYQSAKADFAEAIRVSSDLDKHIAYETRAHFELGLSEIAAAIEDYTQAIARNPKLIENKYGWALAGRAHAYLVQGETARALADCERALRIQPSIIWVHGYRGFALARLGHWDRALADFTEAASRQPELKASWLTAKASVLALASRFAEAEKAFDEVARKNPDTVRWVLASRGYYLDRLRGDHDQAIKNLTLAEHAIWPPCAFLYRGSISARRGDTERALADLKRFMEFVDSSRPDIFAVEDFVPRRLVFLLARGEAFLTKADLEHALADAEEAVRFSATSAEARLLRARVYEKQGKDKLAEADRRAAAQLTADPIVAAPITRP